MMESRLLRYGLLGLVLLLGPGTAGWPSGSIPASGARVRIAVLSDVPSCWIKIRGAYTLRDPETGAELAGGPRMGLTRIVAEPEGIRVGRTLYASRRLRFTGRDDIAISQQDQERRYRGDMDVILDAAGRLLFVNTLGVDEYIRGVLYHEVSHRWPLEAIKAQAVASRTYAMYQISKNKGREYDVSSDIYSQVYGGKTSEHYRTNIAIERTAGEVLMYKGEVLPAYFHATCGGYTEDATELWNHPPMQPLSGVPCRFCALSPHFSWKKNFQLKDIQDRLNAKGYELDLIKDIRVVQRDKSDRIRELAITTRQGKTVRIPGKDFRLIVGPNDLRSNNYRIEMKGYYCDFIGHGWGHGVGLCQWGAMGMARERYDYRQILQHYYPGAVIQRMK